MPTFANRPKGFVMKLPRTIKGARRMTIGDDVKLGPGSILKCQTSFPGGWMEHPDGDHAVQEFDSRIVIGDRVTATGSLTVVAFAAITIGADVMFASNVFVTDGDHAFEHAREPYKFQGVAKVAPVTIGRGSWLGQNVVVMPGVTIGELVIVGANTVVTRDVPPKSIVVGAPARVLRRWDDEAGEWVRLPRPEAS